MTPEGLSSIQTADLSGNWQYVVRFSLLTNVGSSIADIQQQNGISDAQITQNEELLSMLSEPDVANDPKRFQKLMKEQADLAPIVEAYKEYKENKQNIEDSLAMLQEESDEELRELAKEELELGYRTSVIAKKGYIVLEAVLKLQKGEKEKIQAVMDDLKERRVTKQPLEYPSAGSTFKRGEDYITAKLIDECGLKGYTIGGAQVSEKHAGFIINKGNLSLIHI